MTVATRIVSDTAPAAKKTTADAAGDSQPTAAAAADSVHYFQVPVAFGPAGQGATGYVALSMPAEVTAPRGSRRRS
ncbi:hypothetical protein [Streptomyces sp. NPDC007856]|uniref:hypothetical protein n=1 Tax=Streptomyces sp. NPDC007856 TaxID=3364781 RepID=UPI0036CCA70D